MNFACLILSVHVFVSLLIGRKMEMKMVPKIPPSLYTSSQLTCLSYIAKTAEIIKKKLTSRQLRLFRNTVFGYLLDVDLVFKRPLIHSLLLREVEESSPDTISLNLFGSKVSFGWREFDLINGLKYSRAPIRKDTFP